MPSYPPKCPSTLPSPSERVGQHFSINIINCRHYLTYKWLAISGLWHHTCSARYHFQCSVYLVVSCHPFCCGDAMWWNNKFQLCSKVLILHAECIFLFSTFPLLHRFATCWQKWHVPLWYAKLKQYSTISYLVLCLWGFGMYNTWISHCTWGIAFAVFYLFHHRYELCVPW